MWFHNSQQKPKDTSFHMGLYFLYLTLRYVCSLGGVLIIPRVAMRLQEYATTSQLN